MTEKCKHGEIYRRMYDVFGEASFCKKIFTNGLNICFATKWLSQKGLSIEWKDHDSPVKKSSMRSGQ